MPEVSIIVTTYNVAPFIETALQSALDAALDDAEILVVDDGSTDSTRRRTEAVIRRNPGRGLRLAPLAHNTPGGVAIAANAGLGLASGEIVAFLDGDDWITPGAFRDAVAELRASDHDFLLTGHQDFLNGTGAVRPAGDLQRRYEARKAIDMTTRRKALLRCAPMPWGKIYRRAFLERENILFPEGDYFFEDTVHHWRAALRARSVGFFDRVTHTHRVGQATQTIGGRGRKFLAIFEHHDTIRADLIARGELELYAEDLARWLLNHLVWCMERIDAGGAYAMFDAAAPRIALHDPATLDAEARARGMPPLDAALMAALLAGDRSAFATIFAATQFPQNEDAVRA